MDPVECVAMVVTSLDTYALTDCTLYETQGGEKVIVSSINNSSMEQYK